MRMTKKSIMHDVLDFGYREERQLEIEGKHHEAYQIRCARNNMVYALMKSIKEFRLTLFKMTEYTVDCIGEWHYDPVNFVTHTATREMVQEFRKEFENARV